MMFWNLIKKLKAKIYFGLRLQSKSIRDQVAEPRSGLWGAKKIIVLTLSVFFSDTKENRHACVWKTDKLCTFFFSPSTTHNVVPAPGPTYFWIETQSNCVSATFRGREGMLHVVLYCRANIGYRFLSNWMECVSVLWHTSTANQNATFLPAPRKINHAKDWSRLFIYNIYNSIKLRYKPRQCALRKLLFQTLIRENSYSKLL